AGRRRRHGARLRYPQRKPKDQARGGLHDSALLLLRGSDNQGEPAVRGAALSIEACGPARGGDARGSRADLPEKPASRHVVGCLEASADARGLHQTNAETASARRAVGRFGLSSEPRILVRDTPARTWRGNGTVDEVVRNAGLTTYIVQGPRLDALAEKLRARPGVEQVAPFGATLHVVGSDEKALQAALADIEASHKGVTVEPGETSLEDVFIQFMAGSKDNMA